MVCARLALDDFTGRLNFSLFRSDCMTSRVKARLELERVGPCHEALTDAHTVTGKASSVLGEAVTTILIILTLIMNVIALQIVKKYREQYD